MISEHAFVWYRVARRVNQATVVAWQSNEPRPQSQSQDAAQMKLRHLIVSHTKKKIATLDSYKHARSQLLVYITARLGIGPGEKKKKKKNCNTTLKQACPFTAFNARLGISPGISLQCSYIHSRAKQCKQALGTLSASLSKSDDGRHVYVCAQQHTLT